MSIENAVASTDIKNLTRQFYAAKSLIISQQETIKYYSQKDFDTNERRIKALQQSINSEREMNAKLTAEIAELEERLDYLLSKVGVGDSGVYLAAGNTQLDKVKSLENLKNQAEKFKEGE